MPARTLFLLCLFLLQWLGTAVEARPLHEMRMEVWTVDRGLPHNTVLTLAQTSDGYLWLGTWQGLQRFDGARFESAPDAAPEPLNSVGILALSAAPDGSLWVGTHGGGLFQHHRGRWRTHIAPGSTLRAHIIALLASRSGALYVGTSDGQLLRLQDGQQSNLGFVDAQPGNISGLAEGSDGRIVVVSDAGLLEIRGDHAASLAPAVESPLGQIDRIQARARGGYWLVGFSGLLLLSEDLTRVEPGGFDAPVTRVYEDSNGAVWLGAEPRRLVRLQAGTVQTMERSDGLPNGRIASLLEDHEGNMWLGTNGGLIRMHAAAFAAITERQGLADPFIRSILQRRDGSMVVAGAGGINLIRDGRVVESPASWPESVRQRPSLALAESTDGRLLIGSNAAGAWELGPDGVRQRSAPQELGSAQVRAILPDADGSIWYGSTRGLSHCSAQSCRRYGSEDGLTGAYITALYRDRDGVLWVGSSTGLSRHDGSGFETIPLQGDAVQTVFAVLQDSQGRHWVGSDGGLGVLVDDRVHLIRTTQGLVDNAVFAVLQDQDQQLWISSNRGVMRLDPDQAVAVALGKQERISGRVFTRADGLPASQANGGSQAAAIRTEDGRLWFATAGGVAVIDPSEARGEPTPAPPRLALDAILLDGHRHDTDTPLRVDPLQRRLQFLFSGISYSAPERMHLQYRLSGFDADWQLAGRERSASYTNLAPGQYRFDLRAGWPDNPEAGEQRSLEFDVLPAWYQRTWVRLALSLLVLGVLAALVLWRLGALRRQAAALKREVAIKTQDLQAERDALAQANAQNAQLAERLGRLAREDELTGIANRRHADSILRELLQSAPGPVIAMIDLDHFKRINDQHGHAAGDQALQAFAQALRKLSPMPMLLARIGGEEFLVAWSSLSVADADAALHAVREQLLDEQGSDQAAQPIRFSAGIAAALGDDSLDHWYGRADAALYQAKAAGRNRSVVALL